MLPVFGQCRRMRVSPNSLAPHRVMKGKRMRRLLLPIAAALMLVTACQTSAPSAAFIDPPHDAAHPARMEVLHIPSGGVEINGVAYLA